jgi:coenzyme PQQ precursor peptide PqqA
VIVGPRADELQTGPARVRFSFLGTRARGAPCGTSAANGACAQARPDLLYGGYTRTLGKRQMAWTTPTLVEICIGLEINGYLPAEF